MPWFLRYRVEGVRLESGPYVRLEDAELWRAQTVETMPSVTDVEVAWEGDDAPQE